MKYTLAAARFILPGLVALLLVLLVALEGCTVGPKYVKPSVPTSTNYKEQAPISFKESDQRQPAHPADQERPGKLVGAFWRFAAQQLGGADSQFQPEPKGGGSSLPGSPRSDSLQSDFAVSNHLHRAQRQLRQELGFSDGASLEDPTVQQRRFRASLRSLLRSGLVGPRAA